MSTSDELAKLGELHQKGVLSDEEFARAKARLLDGLGTRCSSDASAVEAVNALRRSRSDRWLGGVCGGLGRLTGIASWVWRLVFTLMFMFGGSGGFFYLLMWIFVPQDSEAPRLQTPVNHAS
ncbi:PspC domain-containing protein [Piscinibacter terrae]|uniref:PspC domain-containing protein n=1 Tax=Piscinibacter terrae TaxID=2496871 RepID=A0A3N7HW04_9BURK|nr:PspC domain-containing protein [Albitalea terrae]RQP26487.1 PspC domain-containing protein [Albitalea terrae]